MAEDKKVITIDNKDYTEDQLTDKQKVIINHLQSLTQKIASAEFNLDQLKVGKEAFINLLTSEMNATDEDAVAE
tara:strand:+ start:270 stop:491 length:222 start_codon:yes stop_codon:yes gene_type:complete